MTAAPPPASSMTVMWFADVAADVLHPNLAGVDLQQSDQLRQPTVPQFRAWLRRAGASAAGQKTELITKMQNHVRRGLAPLTPARAEGPQRMPRAFPGLARAGGAPEERRGAALVHGPGVSSQSA